ncbi:glutamate--cysteine ligase [Aestuariibacter salexigens]|uniref:glutamate--cysteine ligase n=1 Tax=Aestuariibacter salexigens TaxID=226010 RepID=UPI000413A3D7|nr:glutamate--cysteine ligase [Aestuariibacter salexigens]
MNAHHNQRFADRLALLSGSEAAQALIDIRHGVERETLRINPNGKLATTPHPQALGSALTHDSITTDFSESLLEFITPPERDPIVTLSQLSDIHKYTIESLGDERLWPMSMPCYISNDDAIPIAYFGTSNVAKMKQLYRVGLRNRYGSMMQAIAGVHFNFSLPKTFWQRWLPMLGETGDKQGISAAYFSLIRNYRRLCWLVPYLYGASPALCSSFIQGRQTDKSFEKIGKGTIYLPYATSLRMSDLGYTNSAQSTLNICYNHIDTYIASLRRAIATPSSQYSKLGVKRDGEYQQLNANVLQIENELYSPIRPKQPTRSMEKPTDALAERGVEYIEVRALDVNPFAPLGVELNQFYFLDVFLLYCAIKPSPSFDLSGYRQTEHNLTTVVERGRRPGLMLEDEGRAVSLQDWARELFDDFYQVARLLDDVNQNDRYSKAVSIEWNKVLDANKTPSGMLLEHLLKHNLDNGAYGVELAEKYRQQWLSNDYKLSDRQHFAEAARQSIAAQREIEASDNVDFENFLTDYFADLSQYADTEKAG